MPSVVFILIDQDQRVLMEQRPDLDSHFPNEWLFPGGKLDEGEQPSYALRREMREELGVRPMGFLTLGQDDQVYYARPQDESHRLYPYLVTNWRGEVPDCVLDTGNLLAWCTLDEALASPIECTRQMATLVRDVLRAADDLDEQGAAIQYLAQTVQVYREIIGDLVGLLSDPETSLELRVVAVMAMLLMAQRGQGVTQIDAGEIARLTGIDRATVEGAVAQLNDIGAEYRPAEEGVPGA